MPRRKRANRKGRCCLQRTGLLKTEDREVRADASAVVPALEGNSPQCLLCSRLLSLLNACLSDRSLLSVRKRRAGSQHKEHAQYDTHLSSLLSALLFFSLIINSCNPETETLARLKMEALVHGPEGHAARGEPLMAMERFKAKRHITAQTG